MDKSQIENIVETSFDKAFSAVRPAINMELYPAAFADEHSWLRIKAVFELNNQAIRTAVKESLVELLAGHQD